LSNQMQEQICLGQQVDAGEITLAEAMAQECPPIWKDGTLLCDENHTQAKIGGNGHGGSSAGIQYRISVDPMTGELLRMGEGGVMPRRKERVQAKYTKEARGCYGCACPMIDEECEAQFMETWNYTETTLRSFKRYQAEERAEFAYRRTSTARGWGPYTGANPYEQRYGNDWKKHLKESPRMKKYT